MVAALQPHSEEVGINVHHSSWHSAINNDLRDMNIADQFDRSSSGIIIEPLSRVTPTSKSLPDATIASSCHHNSQLSIEKPWPLEIRITY